MTTEIQRYTSADLLDLVMEVRPQPKFWQKTLFGREMFSEDQSIEFDIVRKGRRLAPFVAPTVSGKPMLREGFRTESIRPAYVKPQTSIDLGQVVLRQAGESWNNNAPTPIQQQRLDRLMANDVLDHISFLDTRLEWMAQNIIFNGGYMVSGEDYPDQQVDFGQSTQLDVVLAGTATWDQASANPMRDVETAAQMIVAESHGQARPTMVIVSFLAWTLLREHADVKEMLDKRRKDTKDNSTELDLGILSDMDEGWYAGRLNGFDIWVAPNNQVMVGDDGSDIEIMPDYSAVVVDPAALQGTTAFGRILDAGAEWEAQRLFFKSQEQWDPFAIELVSQSAPIVFPRRVNSWMTLEVA